MQTYVYTRGEDIAIALDAVSGDPGIVTAISAALKPLPAGRAVLPPGLPAGIPFMISPRTATPDMPAGWTLNVPAAVSATLKPGNYVADALLQVAGGVKITDQIGIRLREPVVSA
jgi:hypothetical protein